MNSNNYLDEVYTVGENNIDNLEDSSGNDSDRDQRRGRQEFYDTISDPSVMRNALDPVSQHDKLGKSPGFIQTPGTVPYNAPAQ